MARSVVRPQRRRIGRETDIAPIVVVHDHARGHGPTIYDMTVSDDIPGRSR